jgi:hypothetical protein
MAEDVLVKIDVYSRFSGSHGLILSECVVIGPFSDEEADRRVRLLDSSKKEKGVGLRIYKQKLPFKPEDSFWLRYGVELGG